MSSNPSPNLGVPSPALGMAVFVALVVLAHDAVAGPGDDTHYLPPAFGPSVPTSNDGPITYFYEYCVNAWSEVTVGGCTGQSAVSLDGYTAEQASRQNDDTTITVLADRAQREFYTHEVVYHGMPEYALTIIHTNCVYTRQGGTCSAGCPDSDPCAAFNSEPTLSYSCNQLITEELSGPGWTMEYVHPSYEPLCYHHQEDTWWACDPNPQNFHVFLTATSQGGYYRILLNLAKGVACPPLPELNCLAHAGVTGGEPGASCTAAPQNMVSWWRAEGDANDALGVNDGIILDGVSFVAGEVGECFSLDGTNDTLLVSGSEALDVGESPGFTVETWIRPSDVGNGHPVVEWNGVLESGGYGTHIWIGHPSHQPGYFFANIADTDGGWHVIDTSDGLLAADKFQHVALTYDKSTGIACLYLDGAPVSQKNVGVFTPQTSYDLYVGERPSYTPDAPEYVYQGLIDEIGVYSRVLSPYEIFNIYAATTVGKCPP